MRAAAVAVLPLCVLVAGCADDAAPVPPPALFARYAGCAWANDPGIYAADCDDPHGSERYAGASWQPDVPEGWTCGASIGDEEDGVPRWELWTRPPPDDLVAAAPQRLEVAVAYHLDGPVRGVDGVAQVFSDPGQPILRWHGDGPAGFVELGEAPAGETVEFDGAFAEGPIVDGPIDYDPMHDGEHRSEPWSRLNGTGVAVESVGTAWGRHSPIAGWYPRLYGTQVVRVAGETRYLPAAEMPLSGGPDPKTLAGSGHWGSSLASVAWTDVADGAASIRVHQAIHLRFDGHFERLDSLPGCRFCPLLDPSDPLEGVRCRLPGRAL